MKTGDKSNLQNFSARGFPRSPSAESASAQSERAARSFFRDAPAWQRKIARARLRNCQGIDRAVERGETVMAAARRRRRTTRGGSVMTLRRLYYVWRKSGRDAAALLPRYTRHAGFKFTQAKRNKVRLLLHSGGVTSFTQLHRMVVHKRTPSYSALIRSFSPVERVLFRRMFLARLRYWRAEGRFTTFLRDPARTFFGRQQ